MHPADITSRLLEEQVPAINPHHYVIPQISEARVILEDEDELKETNITTSTIGSFVAKARGQSHILSDNGDEPAARKVLELCLEQIREQSRSKNNYEDLEQIDLLLDLNKREEARQLLLEAVQAIRSIPQADTEAPAGTLSWHESDIEYLASLVERMIWQSIRAETWSTASDLLEILQKWDPRYVDSHTEMSFFEKCRQIFHLGSLSEASALLEQGKAKEHLIEALRIYNDGCQQIEVTYQTSDPPQTEFWYHDHVDCAHLFFSAARICVLLNGEEFNDNCLAFTPKSLSLVPSLTEKSWKLQALQFLERGRARGLRETMLGDKKFRDVLRSSRGNSTIIGEAEMTESPLELTQESSLELLDPPKLPDIQLRRGVKRTMSDLGLQILIEHQARKRTFTISGHATPNSEYSSLPSRSQSVISPGSRMRWHKAKDILLDAWKLCTSGPTLVLEKVFKSIPIDTAVVEYALALLPPHSGLITIVTTSEGVNNARWDKLEGRDMASDIRDLLQSLEKQIMDPRTEDTEDEETINYKERAERLLKSLMSKLVDPIRSVIKDKKRLVIIPSGELANAPWSMLFHDRPVCIVPSLSIWEHLAVKGNQETNRQSSAVFISSKPIEDTQQERNIQYSRLEALYLGRIHNDWPKLVDDVPLQPLSEMIREKDIVHLCAHSDYNRLHPTESRVQLPQKPLNLWDWVKLRVHANLVVFSSCLSAFAKTSDSGYGFGFSYTLLSTGTRAFVGSLWPVNDRATLLFMIIFYEELRRGIAPSDAIHRAQEILRTLTQGELLSLVAALKREIDKVEAAKALEYVSRANFYLEDLRTFDVQCLRNPAYWAAFTLVGHGFCPLYPQSL
jgi:CHAT domain-containing protein